MKSKYDKIESRLVRIAGMVVVTLGVLFFMAILLGCKDQTIEPTQDIQGIYTESNITLAHMSPVKIRIAEDTVYRSWWEVEKPIARGAYTILDTMVIEFRNYNNQQVGTGEGVFHDFHIVSKYVWDGDLTIYAYSEWKADGWEGLEYNSIFKKQ